MQDQPSTPRRKILIFTPYNPFQPEHGAHARILQQIKGLKEAGQVGIASTMRSSDKEWPAACETLAEAHSLAGIFIFERSFAGVCDRLARIPMRLFVSVMKRLGRADSAKEARRRLHVWLVHKWFRRLVVSQGIDLVVINYTKWADLIEGLDRRVVTVLELHDLAPINHFLATEIGREIAIRGGVAELKRDYRQFNYVTQAAALPVRLRAELEREVAGMARFHAVVSISDAETAMVRARAPDLPVETLYPEFMAVAGGGDVRAAEPGAHALIPTGPSIFNSYSLLRYFDVVEKRIEYTDTARVDITGRNAQGHGYRLPARHAYLGLVDDYPDRLRASRFVIAPTLVGTGQQMKIFEALSHGVPVVCYRAAAPEFLRMAGVGVVAVEDDIEFARAVSRFWQDEAYCRRLRAEAAAFARQARRGFSYRDLADKYCPV
ncbi:MAG: glycosyltransferase family 4 protein [Thiobacillus sp.]|nr:glycosyltransferase family 4 protein [Thiobacillus sp.]